MMRLRNRDTSRPSRLFQVVGVGVADRASIPPRVPRGSGKEAATVLAQDALDKDIKVLNGTTDVETEN
jgi:hypothetical protein